MNNIIPCPACGYQINGEHFSAPHSTNTLWYVFEHSHCQCLACGEEIAYNGATKWLIITTSVLILTLMLLLILQIIPVVILLAASPLMGFIAYRRRRLVIINMRDPDSQ